MSDIPGVGAKYLSLTPDEGQLTSLPESACELIFFSNKYFLNERRGWLEIL